jgi:hypothetical protein
VAVAREVDVLVAALVQLEALAVEFRLDVEGPALQLLLDLNRFRLVTLKLNEF